MDWTRDLADWPLRNLSRRIASKPHDWHVQDTGTGPIVLFVHGAGGSSHSFRDLLPLLADQYRCIALDLPGQGFTRLGTKRRSSLRLISEDIARLCNQEGWQPVAILGHSAGGAIALRLSQMLTAPDGAPPLVIGINAALAPFDGVAGWLFPVLAKMLVLNPLVPRLFSLTSGNPQRAQQLIEGTGSKLTPEGLALYAKLVADRDHVDATLRMMAQWDLTALLQDLPHINARTTLITAENDRAVPPVTSTNAAKLLPNARVIALAGLGHLAHEEDPDQLAGVLRAILTDQPLMD